MIKKLALPQLNVIQNLLVENVSDLIDALDVRLRRGDRYYYGPCPVHQDSDNRYATNLYYRGDRAGKWKCNTRHDCNNVFRPTIIGFVRGVLSAQQHNWSQEGDRCVSFHDTMDWVSKFLNQDVYNIKYDASTAEKVQFSSQIATINTQALNNQRFWPIDQITSKLQIPPEYLLQRQYPAEILQQYHIGLATDDRKGFYNRVIFPILTDDGKHVAGFVGRTIYDQCSVCKMWHSSNESCPTDNFIKYVKYRDSGDVVKSLLYNYWVAKHHIKNTGVCYIVEGPTDCLRMIQAGFNNTVALFGNNLTDRQLILLELCGTMKVVLLLDNDEAGKSAKTDIAKRLSMSYRVEVPEFAAKDIGKMTALEIKQLLGDK